MAPPIADKIKKTESSFPAQKPGAVAECPYRDQAAEQPAIPLAAKTAYQMTQDMARTMGVSPGVPVSAPPEKPKEKKAWIEIILIDPDGQPMPGVRYRITPPGGGAPKEGRLNEHGQAGLYQIEPGQCKITFPDIDQDAWE